jgi:ferredoxin-NADP reductase/predicted pyridoxine 5'-phosphate oxidase superfamily flavin-nucleotide-binding protein
MAHRFAEIAFTPEIRSIQAQMGSRSSYAAMDAGEDYNHVLGARESSFITARDSFYMASVSETGWPYVQHRGGPAGFLKVLDERSIGFADYSGNRQYVSTGNFRNDNRVSLFFMDYPNRRRLKMLGRVRTVGLDESELLSQLEDRDYPAQIERGFIIEVEAFDWNCPQHITPRFSEKEVEEQLTFLRTDNERLGAQLNGNRDLRVAAASMVQPEAQEALGEGPLELVVSGIRQLTPRIRAYEFRDSAGDELPALQPGSHLRIPVSMASSETVERHYSIASNPLRRDIYEIAVLREDEGDGGSVAVHESYRIGTRLRVDLPGNHFGLHDDQRPALLIAGGIGITAIKSMAQALENRASDFQLHYAGRSRGEMAFSGRLELQLGERLSLYSSAEGDRLDIAATLARAADDALIYVCGPKRLIGAVTDAARELGIARERVRLELFD